MTSTASTLKQKTVASIRQRPSGEASERGVWHSVAMQEVPRIGPYFIVAELGRGGMGVVYEVSDPSLPGRRLALKQILKDLCGPDALRRFAREAEMLAKVQHPNVVRVYACTLDPVAYLVTELVEGQDLHSLSVREHVEPERSAEIVAQLCDAIGALHSAGIIHRDLKPENAILRPDGTPVLLDFGLARELDGEGLTRTGEVLGTPAYMSPEQADAAKDIDERTDVYGLGAILYQLLAGRAPFQAESMIKLLYKVLQEEPDWSLLKARAVPRPLIAVVQRALEKERDDRYPSGQALAADLRRYLGGEAVLAQPRRRGRGLLIAGTVALLAVAAALGVASLPRDEQETPSPTRAQATPTPSHKDRLAGMTSLQFRGLPPGDQADLIEAFLARLGKDQLDVAFQNLRGKPLWQAEVYSGENQDTGLLERGALFLPDDAIVNWIGVNQTLICVSARDGGRLWKLKLPHVVNACALAPDGKSLLAFDTPHLASRVVAGPEGWSSDALQVEEFELGLSEADYSGRPVKCAAFSPDGQSLVLGLGARKPRVRSGALLIDQFTHSPPRVRQLGTSPESACAMTSALAWSRDSKRVYLGGQGVEAEELATFGFDLSRPEPRLHFQAPTGMAQSMTTFAICLPGEDLVQAQKNGFVRRFKGIAQLNVPTPPEVVSAFVTPGGSFTKTHTSMVTGAMATQDGNWIYTVAGPLEDVAQPVREISVWRRTSPGGGFELALGPLDYPSSARRAYLSEDGKRLLLVGMDGILRCYDAWLLRQ